MGSQNLQILMSHIADVAVVLPTSNVALNDIGIRYKYFWGVLGVWPLGVRRAILLGYFGNCRTCRQRGPPVSLGLQGCRKAGCEVDCRIMIN